MEGRAQLASRVSPAVRLLSLSCTQPSLGRLQFYTHLSLHRYALDPPFEAPNNDNNNDHYTFQHMC